MVLVKEFRADIPARPAADAGHAIDRNVHLMIPYTGKNRLEVLG
jgi:hypothetical protein